VEKLEALTKSSQIIVDSVLSEESKGLDNINAPFNYAVFEEIQKYLNLEGKDIDSSTIEKMNSVELPPYSTGHSVSHYYDYSRNLQSWIGHVTEIRSNSFDAELNDLTSGGTKEMVEIQISDISPQDRKLVSVGAIFYWNIGSKMRKGQITNESIIRFQRVVLWNEEDFNKASDRANDLYENLKFE